MIRLTFCVGLPPTSCWGMISRGAWTLCPGCCWGVPWRSAFTLISCTFPPVGNIVDGLPTIAGCTAPLITWLVVFPTVTTPRTKKERILYYLYLYDTPQQNNYLKHLAIFFFFTNPITEQEFWLMRQVSSSVIGANQNVVHILAYLMINFQRS